MKNILLILSAIIFFEVLTPQVTYAQTTPQSTPTAFRRNIGTVLFATLGGALLGLSTLSFYKNAQDHTNNISMGALLGFAGGVGYVAYTNTQVGSRGDLYSEMEMEMKKVPTNAAPLLVSYQFEF